MGSHRQAKASCLMSGQQVPAFGSADYLAELLGVSPTYARRLCRNKVVPAAKVGRAWRVNIPGALKALNLVDAQTTAVE